MRSANSRDFHRIGGPFTPRRTKSATPISPKIAGSKPAMVINHVDFPAPLGPVITVEAPAGREIVRGGPKRVTKSLLQSAASPSLAAPSPNSRACGSSSTRRRRAICSKGPSATMRPCAISTARSSNPSHAVCWCSTTTRVAPVSSTSAETARTTSRAPAGSRLAVGSSSSTTPAPIAITPAKARRCFCPPDRRSVGKSKSTNGPTRSLAAATRRQISSLGYARFSQPKAISSPTRAEITCESGSCNTSPTGMECPGSSTAPVESSKRISPVRVPSSSEPSTPAIAARKVDFPDPESPQSNTRSPGSITRSISANAGWVRPECVQPKPRAVIFVGRPARVEKSVTVPIRPKRAVRGLRRNDPKRLSSLAPSPRKSPKHRRGAHRR